jgi:hypothetical protein
MYFQFCNSDVVITVIDPEIAMVGLWCFAKINGGRRGRDRMVIEFTTTCVISVYHH